MPEEPRDDEELTTYTPNGLRALGGEDGDSIRRRAMVG